MKDNTEIGQHSQIGKTSLTMLSGFDSSDQSVRQDSLETLTRYYWKPVYKYFRLKWKQSNEQAKDLTQSFFASLLDSSTLQKYDPQTSSFRHYLKVCADRFANNNDRDQKRLKRGGGIKIGSLDFDVAESELDQASTLAQEPEDVFHIEWLRNLVDISLTELRSTLEAKGKQVEFELFHMRDVEPTDGANVPQYVELAERFSIPVTQVNNFLAGTRRLFRQIVRQNIRNMATSHEEYESELTVLFSGMAASENPDSMANDD